MYSVPALNQFYFDTGLNKCCPLNERYILFSVRRAIIFKNIYS
jgi:hypothetical protein